MNSEDGDASKYELLHLIYLHLKENGYKKAANVLRKHVTQTWKTPCVNELRNTRQGVQNETAAAAAATLHDIYKSWAKTSDSVKTKEVADIDATLVKTSDPEKLEKYEDAVSPDSTAKNGGETVDPKPIVELAGAPTNTGPVPADSQAPKDSDGSQNAVCPVSVVMSDVTALRDGPASEVKSGSSDDATEQEVPVLQKKMSGSKLLPTEVSATAVNASKAEGSSADSDSEDEASIPPSKHPGGGGSGATVKPGLVSLSLGKAGNKAPASEEKAVSSESGSSDESESEEEKAPPLMMKASQGAAGNLVAAAALGKAKASASAKREESDDTDSSDTEAETLPKGPPMSLVKLVQPSVNKAKAPLKSLVAGKKATCWDSASTESEGSEDDEEEKAPSRKTAAPNPTRTAAVVAAEKPVGGATASPVKATPRAPVIANVDSDSSETDDEVIVKKAMWSPKVKGALATPVSKPPAPFPGPPGEGVTTDSSTSEEEAELTKAPVSSKAVLATPKTAVASKEQESGSEDSSEDGGAPLAVEAVKTVTDPGSAADAGYPVTPTSPVSKEEEGPAPSPGQEVTEPKSPEIVPSEDTAPDQPIPAPGEPTLEDLSPGEEEISQAVLEPVAAAEGSTPKSKKSKEGKTKEKKRKEKKKKRDSAPSEETSAPDDPAKGKICAPIQPVPKEPSSDTPPVDLDILIAEERRAAEEPSRDEDVLDSDTSPQEARSETPLPFPEDASAEPAGEAPHETVAPLAKRRRAEEDTQLLAKKKKKKKKKERGQLETATAEEEETEPAAASPAVGLSESSEVADEVVAQDTDSNTNSGSATIILSAKLLKKRRKAMKKKMMLALLAKEEENRTPKAQKINKKPKKKKKVTPPTIDSVMNNQSGASPETPGKVAGAKASLGKRPFPAPAAPQTDGQETPKKKKNSDKKDARKLNFEPEAPLPSPPGKKKDKKKKKKKKKAEAATAADEMEITAEAPPPSAAANPSPVSEKKKKKKNKLEKEERKRKMDPPAAEFSPLTSPAPGNRTPGKKKKSPRIK